MQSFTSLPLPPQAKNRKAKTSKCGHKTRFHQCQEQADGHMDKHMARIPTLRKLRQDACHNFKASLDYIVSSCQQEVHKVPPKNHANKQITTTKIDLSFMGMKNKNTTCHMPTLHSIGSINLCSSSAEDSNYQVDG